MQNMVKRFSLKFKKITQNIKKYSWKQWLMGTIAVFGIIGGLILVWVSTLQLPDFKSFTERKIQSSTRIYDRTGTILLYDVHQDIKRTVIPYEAIGTNVKNATVAIEDSEFYQHNGIRISSIIRATIWAKLTGKKVQGGSTITQQLIKNTLLNQERTVTRKIKEWILAMKLERVLSKDEILTLYFNEAPYGGNIYGVEEASRAFFGKEPTDLSIAEAAYLAAIPNAPTHFSPYGKYKNELDSRKNLVIRRMYDLKFINNEERDKAMAEKVIFLPAQPLHIAAPHFVFFIKDYLETKYGQDALDSGLKVITTLDYDLQNKAEAVALAQSKVLDKAVKGSNTAIVAIDPKTGQVLSMVGSRNYFDKTIDGNFNVATAARQPGSSFKPIVYAQAFKEGYTSATTLFDVPTEFNSSCSPSGVPLAGHKNAQCYSPDSFDGIYRGPLTLKNALAQSINVIAVKVLYLVGIPDALKMAHDLGITTLNDPTRYGLSLVIGGGETTLLDMTSAYSVFASDGVRHPYQAILSVEDSKGKVLEKYEDRAYQVLDSNITRTLSDILSDNTARTPTFGQNSKLVIPGREVAAKTGTTNNNRDAWTIGYTPSLVVGVWVGKNDNTPMKQGGVSLAAPIWNEVMTKALKDSLVESFEKPDPIDPALPPIFRGYWQGNDPTPDPSLIPGNRLIPIPGTLGPVVNTSVPNVHTILYWIDKDNPFGPRPTNPENDPQYANWEYGVQKWWMKNGGYGLENTTPITTQTNGDKPEIAISGVATTYRKDQTVYFSVVPTNQVPLNKVDIYVNNVFITSLHTSPFASSFILKNMGNILQNNTLRAIGYDNSGNIVEKIASFQVTD